MGILKHAATLLALACCAGGCATTATGDRSDLTRKAAGLGQAGWLYVRSVYENPINRPVSHVASLGSLTVKSTGGALRRVSLNAFEMPALDGPIPAVGRRAPMDLAAFESLLDRTTGTRLDSGRIRFLVDGHEYFARLMNAIAQARESVDIRTYIFDNDDFAVAIADELRERAKDVRVRVMIDSLGNVLATQADSESLPDTHNHPLSMKRYLEQQSDLKVRQVTNPWLTSDHTKTTIIDRKIAFVGGMNIGREYRYDWHDMMMEVTGPVVDQLQFESEKAWSRSGPLGDFANVLRFVKGKQEHADRDGYPLRVLQTRNFNSQIHRAQIAAIQNARSYIYIQNPYFSDDRTLYELARARRRGVDVRVIIPARGNHGPLNASNKVTINTLLEHGIRVFEYPGMSHIKAAVYDGWMCVGSANFDKLSLKVNKELNLATSDPATVDALLSKVFVPDILISREITRPVPVSGATYWAEIMVDELM